MASTSLDIQPQYRGFRYKGVEFILGGSCGPYVELAYLQRFSGLIILRQGSFDMPEVWSAEVFVMTREPENSVLYSSNGVVIWAQVSKWFPGRETVCIHC